MREELFIMLNNFLMIRYFTSKQFFLKGVPREFLHFEICMNLLLYLLCKIILVVDGTTFAFWIFEIFSSRIIVSIIHKQISYTIKFFYEMYHEWNI